MRSVSFNDEGVTSLIIFSFSLYCLSSSVVSHDAAFFIISLEMNGSKAKDAIPADPAASIALLISFFKVVTFRS